MHCISVLPHVSNKKVNSACSVLYLHRKRNTIVLICLYIVESIRADFKDNSSNVVKV